MKRYALCIGNAEYKNSELNSLPAARKDADAIGKKLRSLGFTVDVEYDLESREMAMAIGRLEDKLKQFDSILFYYAGHGFEIDGENILAPINLNPADDKSAILFDAYKLSELMNLLEKADNNKVPKTKIIILDACRTQLKVRGLSLNFAPICAPQGSIIAFSTSPGRSAKEDQNHGKYTNTLLRYMDVPRVSIERVFKMVRTALVNETSGLQIPWEHTSLIGDFYFNSNTIYDGPQYSKEAMADSGFIFSRESKIKSIVTDLKSLNFYKQRDAIASFEKIPRKEIDNILADELFVLGRNIYQAACGGCWGCQRFINNFNTYSFISDEAKCHILNGMGYEIYYDNRGNIRNKFKLECFNQVIELLEKEEYYGSLRFISSKLENENNIFYIPGQNDKVEVSVNVIQASESIVNSVKEQRNRASSVLVVKDITYNGRSIYFDLYSSEKAVVGDDYTYVSKTKFETELQNDMAVARGYLSINYYGEVLDDNAVLLIPLSGFSVYSSEKQ